ncbi:hypothetical protein CGZ80_14825 [Rhodopirellula sp. MGV]|nr:hypothetical protein CGZ80_14825 [Rhodopirellula sp. MGV]PNY35263.1 hypothetical protein C2E31_19160 [Rhodopirellula baltica]
MSVLETATAGNHRVHRCTRASWFEMESLSRVPVTRDVRVDDCGCNDRRLMAMPIASSCPSRTSWFKCFVDGLIGARECRPSDFTELLFPGNRN